MPEYDIELKPLPESFERWRPLLRQARVVAAKPSEATQPAPECQHGPSQSEGGTR